ncbi:MAG: hypothetical protein JW909_13415 [Planctomycetes bacterium]|nr:hypothetical protein [Planctomycetota bacterium]
MAMTPRERVLAVLKGEPVDKVPFTIYECMIPQCAIERELRNRGLCIVHRRTPVYKSETPHCAHEQHHYSEDGRRLVRNVYTTPAGELATIVEPAGFTSWTREHIFKSPDDYGPLIALVEDTVYTPCFEDYLRDEAWMGDDAILRGGIGAIPLHHIMVHMMGVETFAVEWAERRDSVLALEAAMRRAVRPVYDIMRDSPVTHANYSGNFIPEMMGLERFLEFVLPLLDEAADVLHEKGKLLGSHMDGNNRLWASHLGASRMDYIEAFTPAPDTDMSMEDAFRAWPGKAMWINFPSSLFLADDEKIRSTAREIIKAAGDNGRLIIGITEDMPPDRWQAGLTAIMDGIDDMA